MFHSGILVKARRRNIWVFLNNKRIIGSKFDLRKPVESQQTKVGKLVELKGVLEGEQKEPHKGYASETIGFAQHLGCCWKSYLQVFPLPLAQDLTFQGFSLIALKSCAQLTTVSVSWKREDYTLFPPKELTAYENLLWKGEPQQIPHK